MPGTNADHCTAAANVYRVIYMSRIRYNHAIAIFFVIILTNSTTHPIECVHGSALFCKRYAISSSLELWNRFAFVFCFGTNRFGPQHTGYSAGVLYMREEVVPKDDSCNDFKMSLAVTHEKIHGMRCCLCEVQHTCTIHAKIMTSWLYGIISRFISVIFIWK